MQKLICWALAGLAGLFLTIGPAAAVTVNFNFNSGLGPNFTFYQRNTTNVALDDTGGNLRIYSSGMSGTGVRGGEVMSNFTIQGDFDLIVDFTINNPLATSQQVEVHPHGMAVFYPIRDNSGGGNNYHVWTGSVQGRQSTDDLMGTLRLRRVGSTAYGYFWSYLDHDYTLMYSGSVSTSDFAVGLMVQNNDSQTGSFNVAFDNLYITADGITGLVPLPPGLLLLGTGLGLLAAHRWRRRR
jgi:hypothetical protein